MPHAIVEYSYTIEKQIDPDTLLDAVFKTVQDSPLFNAIDVRARRMVFEGYRLGSAKGGFIHVTIRLLQGRSDREKTELTRQIVEAIKDLSLSDLLISCECVDIDTPTYQREML